MGIPHRYFLESLSASREAFEPLIEPLLEWAFEIISYLVVDPIILIDFLHIRTPAVSENTRREGDICYGDNGPLSKIVVMPF